MTLCGTNNSFVVLSAKHCVPKKNGPDFPCEERCTFFGQTDREDGIKIIGKQSRKEVFFTKVIGPLGEQYTDPDAVQETFVQQRGFKENEEGVTGDVRSLQEKGVLTPPITGPKQVSPKGDPQDVGSAFYDE